MRIKCKKRDSVLVLCPTLPKVPLNHQSAQYHFWGAQYNSRLDSLPGAGTSCHRSRRHFFPNGFPQLRRLTNRHFPTGAVFLEADKAELTLTTLFCFLLKKYNLGHFLHEKY